MTASGLLAAVVGALLSSSLTLLAVALSLRWYRRRRLPALLEEAGRVVADRVAAELERAAARVTPRLGGAVRDGVVEAGGELLPKVRAEVREGFKEAIGDALAGKTLERAGETLARKGASVVEAGLDLLFGRDDQERR